MTDVISVRDATQSDTETIADFNAAMAVETEKITLNRVVLEEGVRAALSDRNKAIYFIAEVGGKIAGQLMITHEWSDWRNGDIWWIQSVYVAPSFRRRGVFKALYLHAQTEAKKHRAIGLRLYVEQNNVIAQRTYQQLGMILSHYKVMEAFF